MPQMFPLLWTLLFFSVMCAIMIMGSVIHFMLSLNESATSNSTGSQPLNPVWKW